MIKTVKVKKQFRLDELIKYVWDNNIKAEQELVEYKSNTRTIVTVDMSGQIAVYGAHFGNEVFTVEVEEEITEGTKFKSALVVHHGEELELYENLSIKGFKHRWPNSLQMHAVINGKLELIYERNEESINA